MFLPSRGLNKIVSSDAVFVTFDTYKYPWFASAFSAGQGDLTSPFRGGQNSCVLPVTGQDPCLRS